MFRIISCCFSDYCTRRLKPVPDSALPPHPHCAAQYFSAGLPIALDTHADVSCIRHDARLGHFDTGPLCIESVED